MSTLKFGLGDQVIVCIACYGNYGYGYGRTPEEMRGYDNYLDEIIGYIKTLIEIVRVELPLTIVVCGGKTNPNFDISEAETVYTELISRLERTGLGRDKFNFITERQSANTTQNVFLGIDVISRYGLLRLRNLSQHYIFIFDSLRAMKAIPIARLFCKKYGILHWQVVGFNRPDIHPHSKWYKQFFVACLYWLPFIGRMLIERDLKSSPA